MPLFKWHFCFMGNIRPNIILDEEEWDKLEQFAGLGYSVDKLASYFEQDPIVFKQIAADPNSKLARHIQTGIDRQQMDEHLGVYEAAKGGDVVAFKAIDEIRRTRLFTISKLDIFGGFDSKSKLEKFKQYIINGCVDDLSLEENLYLDALFLIRDLDQQYGKRSTIEFLNKKLNLKHEDAKKIYVEAINLCYHDEGLDKAALRNKYADNLDMAANHVKNNVVTTKDWEIYSEINYKAYKMRLLDKDDEEQIDPKLYVRRYVMYSLDPKDVNMTDIDRNKTRKQIDGLPVSEKDKVRLKEDARLIPLDFKKRLQQTKDDFTK